MSDPNVNATYTCATADARRAVPTPELGARQTCFTVIGNFPDPTSADSAAQDLHSTVESLLGQRDRGESPQAHGIEVEPALLDGLTNVENSVTRLGRTVFLRSEGKRAQDPVALALVMRQLGADVLVEVQGHQRRMNVEVTWDTPDEDLDRALTEEISHYLKLPYELMGRAPWDPLGITPEQADARRNFVSIWKFTIAMSTPQMHLEAAKMIDAVLGGDHEAIKRQWDDQAKQVQESRPEQVRSFLEVHPDFDVAMAETFLRWNTTFDLPQRYKLGAQLGEPMGQLSYDWLDEEGRALTNDPFEAYTGSGAMERVTTADGRERLAPSFISDDVAVGLPALVDYLCARGVESVRYTITDFSDYM